MANSASFQLFDLITSMTRSEKRYFKIHIRTHSSKHSDDYIFLFDSIDEQEAYDESVLIGLMEKSGSEQRFAVLKHRLFEKVLDALESFQRAKDVVMTLRHELNKAKVLLDRGMNRLALNSIKKVLDKAIEVEAHHISLEAATLLELNEEVKEDVLGDIPSHLELVERIDTEYSITIIEKELLKNLSSEGRVRTGLNINSTMQEEYLLQHLEDPQGPVRTRYIAHHSISALYFSRNEIERSLEHVRACVDLLLSNQHLRKEFPLALSKMRANESYIHSRLHDLAASRVCITAMIDEDISCLKVHQLKDFRGMLMQSLLYFLNIQEDEPLEKRLMEELERYAENRWNHPAAVRGAIDYGLGLFFYSKEDRGQAMRYLNRILNDGEIKRDEDVYHRTLVLATVLHAESGDREWMAHSARALKRYLKPRNLLNGVESLLLEYISDFRRARSEEGEERALRQFVHRLRTIRKEPEERVSFEHFDFLAWAERQLGEDYPTGLVA